MISLHPRTLETQACLRIFCFVLSNTTFKNSTTPKNFRYSEPKMKILHALLSYTCNAFMFDHIYQNKIRDRAFLRGKKPYRFFLTTVQVVTQYANKMFPSCLPDNSCSFIPTVIKILQRSGVLFHTNYIDAFPFIDLRGGIAKTNSKNRLLFCETPYTHEIFSQMLLLLSNRRKNDN